MGEIVLKERTPLAGLSVTIGTCHLREVTDLALTSLACPLGGEAAFDACLMSSFGVTRPSATLSTIAGDCRALSLTPDQVLVLHPSGQAVDAGSDAYVTDQTGSWCIVALSGADATEALRRICPLDLDDSVFPVGTNARTVMEHLGALIIKTGPEEYVLLSASSSAKSFWHALTVSLENVSG